MPLHNPLTTIRFEMKEWERSTPGTGSPPTPDLGPEVLERGMASGSRRDPLPLDQSLPNAPHPNQAKPNTNA